MSSLSCGKSCAHLNFSQYDFCIEQNICFFVQYSGSIDQKNKLTGMMGLPAVVATINLSRLILWYGDF